MKETTGRTELCRALFCLLHGELYYVDFKRAVSRDASKLSGPVNRPQIDLHSHAEAYRTVLQVHLLCGHMLLLLIAWDGSCGTIGICLFAAPTMTQPYQNKGKLTF